MPKEEQDHKGLRDVSRIRQGPGVSLFLTLPVMVAKETVLMPGDRVVVEWVAPDELIIKKFIIPKLVPTSVQKKKELREKLFKK